MPRPRGNPFEICPFKVVVDSNESAPYPFNQIKAKNKKPLLVTCNRMPLWNHERRDVEVKGETHSVGFADYSIAGMESRIAIERKSIDDLFGTLASRRVRFEAEIKRLHEDCESASVIVEGDWSAIMLWKGHGPSPASVFGTIMHWIDRYPNVHWHLCPSRAFAEKVCFRTLEIFWNRNHA